ncbi:Arfaptin homology (AH) domain,Arfaptin homology (AH) domain/BAR domain [Cinara cedri]|uniref:Arfaptin homology (AH) domain,Arfaptin homology (AH) domain/BAR domain n=1 Tax=Cinara cedri TaxID=506608 RepID=A0A5E4MIN9_9HEMI|nr:Arfaptin homology (AH) domain,Arfaptin homology (AH) domain/BAR domain [Cinara cedri]
MSLSESGWNTYDAPGLNRWQNNSNGSTVAKMQHKYWVTKQQVCKKLGKKDDEFIVASDAELDAKLELFKSIRGSCQHLQRIVNKYDEKIYNLAYEENQMGLFLRKSGNSDQTKAGEMMQILGSCMAQSGQERLGLRIPLARLHQEIETFCLRAVEDTRGDVKRMENARTDYRAALNWMKDVSQELDPDTNSQLDKFKNVQTKVKKSKQQFDHHKLVCLQKVDLLAAARCNMFSHVLIFYQQSLQRFAETVAISFENATKDFKQYQQYDFKMIKELRTDSVKSTSNPNDTSNNDSSSYTELGIEATCDQDEETNESALLSLFDGSDGFGNFLSNPYDSNKEENNLDLKQYNTGDEFLPSQLLSDLLSAGSAESTIKKSAGSSNWSDFFADLDPLNDPGSTISKRQPLDLL